ncbi:hypothetical protein ES703_78301 [subsurface metagenome]
MVIISVFILVPTSRFQRPSEFATKRSSVSKVTVPSNFFKGFDSSIELRISRRPSETSSREMSRNISSLISLTGVTIFLSTKLVDIFCNDSLAFCADNSTTSFTLLIALVETKLS